MPLPLHPVAPQMDGDDQQNKGNLSSLWSRRKKACHTCAKFWVWSPSPQHWEEKIMVIPCHGQEASWKRAMTGQLEAYFIDSCYYSCDHSSIRLYYSQSQDASVLPWLSWRPPLAIFFLGIPDLNNLHGPSEALPHMRTLVTFLLLTIFRCLSSPLDRLQTSCTLFYHHPT